ncbi:MAG: hypothetical protein ACREOW_13855 [Thermodesulfobacteriota bacterium]
MMNILNNHYFITIDAETDVISESIQVISGIRDEIEKRENIKIPLVWFVRFQRTWDEYVKNDSAEYFKSPVTKGFDGFELAKSQLLRLCKRKDEVGWHYHAYNYVHRDDLSHNIRMKILEADLVSCANEIKARHPYFKIRTFRFGWFFVPDYKIFNTLKEIGIRVDASVNPKKSIKKVAVFRSRYLPPITKSFRKLDGIYFSPFSRTLLIHDWNVVPHEFGWSNLDNCGAIRNQDRFKKNLLSFTVNLKKTSGAFLTYQTFLLR